MGPDASVFLVENGPGRETNWTGSGQKSVEFQHKAQL